MASAGTFKMNPPQLYFTWMGRVIRDIYLLVKHHFNWHREYSSEKKFWLNPYVPYLLYQIQTGEPTWISVLGPHLGFLVTHFLSSSLQFCRLRMKISCTWKKTPVFFFFCRFCLFFMAAVVCCGSTTIAVQQTIWERHRSRNKSDPARSGVWFSFSCSQTEYNILATLQE